MRLLRRTTRALPHRLARASSVGASSSAAGSRARPGGGTTCTTPHAAHAQLPLRAAGGAHQQQQQQQRRASMAAAAAAGAGDAGAPAPPLVQLATAFKTPAAQQAFEQSFHLADGAGVQLVQQPAGSAADWFDAAAFFAHLRSASMGHALLMARSIPSTQEFMRAHTSVLPEGATLVADQQTKGKGRGGNVWTSPPGCLMFTAFRQLAVPPAQAPFLNYVVCLAVVRGIADATAELLPGGLGVEIKWPNDIYYRGLKIGGALIHTTYTAAQRFCVLTGIGLNVSNAQPTTCLDAIVAARLQQQQQPGQQQPAPGHAAPRVCKERLLAAVLSHLEDCFTTFEASGFDPLRSAYLEAWMHSGQVVELEEDAGGGGGGGGGGSGSSLGSIGGERRRRLPLTIVGLSPHGFLLAKDPLGQEYELTPDGNSLDMMAGLIKRKL